MKIGGWQKVSLVDYPDAISAVIFVTQCNFRCPFCFNSDLVLGKLPLIRSNKVIDFLKKRKKVLDGVVISGGEPTLQPDLPEFIKKIKRLGFKIKLDTNGAKPKVLENLIKKNLLDYVAVDFKTTLEDYPKVTKAKIKDLEARIKKTLDILSDSGVDFELRTTVVPTIHDKKVLLKMAKDLKSITENCKLKIENCRWYLQTFQPKNCLNPKFNKLKPYSKMEMEEFLKRVKKIIPQTELRE